MLRPSISVLLAVLGVLGGLATICACSGNSTTKQRQAAVPLVWKTFLDGKVTLLVPAEFDVMDEATLRRKYPNEQRASLVLTNPDASINVIIHQAQQVLSESGLPTAHAEIERAFKNLYPSAKWFRSELTTLNGRKCFTLDLRMPTIDMEVRNMIVVTYLNNRMLMLTFNCTTDYESVWEPVGKEILASAVVSE